MAIENHARQQNEQRRRTAFENSAIGITMADFTGHFFAANSGFLNMLDYTESELYQLTFADVTYEQDRKANQELAGELVEGKRQHFEIEKRYYRKDRTSLYTIHLIDPCVRTVAKEIGRKFVSIVVVLNGKHYLAFNFVQ